MQVNRGFTASARVIFSVLICDFAMTVHGLKEFIMKYYVPAEQ